MKAPLPPVRLVPPQWIRTTTASGAFAGQPLPGNARPADQASAAAEPDPTPEPDPVPLLAPEPLAEPAEVPLEPELRLLPPPPPEHFAIERSEDGRVALTNEGLEVNGEQFGWRELEGVDVQAVRWLLGVLLGAFTFCVFLLGYLQFWLRSVPAALGLGLGIALLAWGLRGTNRWRLHRPGRETRHFAFAGAARNWQQLAREANRRLRQRHHEAAATAAYWLQQAELANYVPSDPGSRPSTTDQPPG